MEKLDLLVWQSDDLPNATFPEPFQPIPISPADLPLSRPLLVSVAGLGSFVEAIQGRPHDPPPEAILFLKHEEVKPAGTFPFIDAIVREGEWDLLQRYLQYPRCFEIAGWAAELPPALIDRLPDRIERREVSQLPLPPLIRELLETNEVYREVFSEILAQDRAFRWSMKEPTTEDLADFVRGRLSASLEPFIRAYLSRSPVGRAQFAVLQQELLIRASLEIHLAETREADDEPRDIEFSGAPPVLRLLALSFFLGRLRIGSRTRYRDLADLEADALPEHDETDLLAALLSGKSLSFEKGDWRFDVTYDDRAGSLRFDGLRIAGNERGSFMIELNRDADTLLRLPSEAGSVRLPLNELRRVVDQGATRLRFVAS